jgi:hypothetical protein
MAEDYEDYLDIILGMDARELAELSVKGREFALKHLDYLAVAERLRKALDLRSDHERSTHIR